MSEDVLTRELVALLNSGPRPPALLRLARGVIDLRELLDAHLVDPLDRALAGLGALALPSPDEDLRRAVLCAQALADADPAALDPGYAARLETAATGSLEWWVPAARLHAGCSADRERRARRALSSQDLPYSMPGELHPLAVEALAAGDRVLEALHVDHVRRLTAFVCEVLPLDGRVLGLWFWPVLRSFDAGRLAGPLAKFPSARRLPPGAAGLAAAYAAATGGRVGALQTPLDRVIFGLAQLSQQAD